MSTINEQPNWENTVTEIDGAVGLLGGESGNFNLPIKQLANRTGYLKVKVDDLINKANVKIAALTNQLATTSVVSNMIAPASVAEGDWLKVTVNLANTLGKTNAPFSVSGSGVDNLDYDYSESKYTNGVTRNSDGTLNIPAGINNFQVQLWIRADSRTEGTDVINITVDGVKSSDCNISDISKGTPYYELILNSATIEPMKVNPTGGEAVVKFNQFCSSELNVVTKIELYLAVPTERPGIYTGPTILLKRLEYNYQFTTPQEHAIPVTIPDFSTTINTTNAISAIISISSTAYDSGGDEVKREHVYVPDSIWGDNIPFL